MSAAYRPRRNGLNRTGRPTHEAVLPSDLVLVLGVSERHVRRILAAHRREGSASAHSSRRLPTARWSTWTVNSRCSTGGRPSPRQQALWNAVQQAKLRGLSIRAIARETGIHRNTVKTYAEAKYPPMKRASFRSDEPQADYMAAARRDIFAEQLTTDIIVDQQQTCPR